MVGFVPPPSYPTPNYDYFGQLLGSLPEVARNAQMQELALQQAQRQDAAARALASGNFVKPDGTIDYAGIERAQLSGGQFDPQAAQFGLQQQQLQQASQPSSLFNGAAVPPAPAGQPSPAVQPGVYPSNRGAVIERLRNNASKYGLSPAETNEYIATGIAEGALKPGAVGDAGSSFGVFQGHVGGLAGGGNRVRGLGDTFMAEKGMTLAQFRSPQGQAEFDEWVAEHWREYGKPNIFHAQRTPTYKNALTYLNARGKTASLETGTMSDAQPSVPPVSASAGVTIPRADDGGRGPSQRTGQPAPQFAQALTQPLASPQEGVGGPGPIVPQYPLPRGMTPQQAIWAIDEEIKRFSGNPAARERIRALEDQRDRIAASTGTEEVRPGQMGVDRSSGRIVYQAPQAGAANVALNRFLAENPDASAEQIQQFVQSGRGARSGIAMFMSKYLQENPEATAADVSKAAQDFHSQGAALTKFTSGPEGKAIRSFNVLVDHLGVLGNAVDALKNGDLRLFNQASQFYAQQTGGTAPTNFDATKALVGDELVKAIVGGGGALGDREEIKKSIDKASSPAQLRGVIEQYRKLAVGQLHGLKKQYESGTSRDDFDNMLAPGTMEFFGGKGAAAPSGNAPKVGHVEQGYRFKGGDPSKKESWEKVD